MNTNITFKKDDTVVFVNISNFINELEDFHRFILSNTINAVGSINKSLKRRVCKVFEINENDKLILNISIQKKIRKNLNLSYKISHFDSIIIDSDQEYKTYEEIEDDLNYIGIIFIDLYNTIEDELNTEEIETTEESVKE